MHNQASLQGVKLAIALRQSCIDEPYSVARFGRDLIAGMLDIYQSNISQRMNEIMKVLTLISTIMLPLTFIAGVYGMNFEYMPELRWTGGYHTTLAVMAGVAATIYLWFRRKGWLRH